MFIGTLVSTFGLVWILTLTVPETNELIDKRFIFFPQKELVGTPAHWGIPFEDVVFPTSDGINLHGWFVKGDSEFTWIWFHGNGGNISHRLEELMLLHSRLGINILLFDYRGYGQSEGTPRAGPRIDVHIDEKYGQETLPLLTSLPAGPHEVRLPFKNWTHLFTRSDRPRR